jgi:hypothetical protein
MQISLPNQISHSHRGGDPSAAKMPEISSLASRVLNSQPDLTLRRFTRSGTAASNMVQHFGHASQVRETLVSTSSGWREQSLIVPDLFQDSYRRPLCQPNAPSSTCAIMHLRLYHRSLIRCNTHFCVPTSDKSIYPIPLLSIVIEFPL